ncbi:ribosome biogenesis protein Slx9p [[Candida] jaroonii]|uniref:Ribosome biogenesis protein Slx9p n=1 Tax=[Candida] jaroonii TaxID=467808 RepID=A0ACA9Y1P7_9ASCO|nr:ribosome biogenesis protein Slx9p [[Candida] jaroonii]
MAIKKTTKLRAKATRASKPKIVNKVVHQYEDNPFLKLSTISKKEKQLTKAKAFNDKIVNTNSTVSKSALRRRKRKAKQALKPKMEELFESLPTLDDKVEEKEFVEQTTISNQPNALKRSGQRIIQKQEHENFNNILKNQQFRSSPFATLRQSIQQNMNQQ